MITIIDYGMGNLGSIANMITKIGHKSIISRDRNEISKAEKIVLPGVGSFDRAIENLNELGLVDLIKDLSVDKKIPTLGICLGMQLMTEKSEEGHRNGFGFIKGEVKKFVFQADTRLKVPHMGWNHIVERKDNVLFSENSPETRFYFVHSYYVACHDSLDILTTTIYGHEFISAFSKGNIYGVQFHPEKSHRFGMQLLKNFVEKC